MANGHGGARRGSGPKPGRQFKRATTAVDISNDGKLQPLHVMVGNMREAYERAYWPKYDLGEEITKFTEGYFEGWKLSAIVDHFYNAVIAMVNFERLSHEYAKDAAPYLHNKLQSIDHNMALAALSSLDDENPEDLVKKLEAKRAKLANPEAAAQVAKLLEFKKTSNGAHAMEKE